MNMLTRMQMPCKFVHWLGRYEINIKYDFLVISHSPFCVVTYDTYAVKVAMTEPGPSTTMATSEPGQIGEITVCQASAIALGQPV